MAGLLVRKFIARCKQGDVVYPPEYEDKPGFCQAFIELGKKSTQSGKS